jgi:hypothetical protein
MRSLITRTVILGVLVLMGGAELADAQGNWRPGDFGSLRFRVGLFEPDGSSQYWDETFDVFTGSPGDLQDITFGADYLWRTSPHGGLMFGTSWYGGSSTQAYRDWVDTDGYDIRHTTSLDLWDVSAAYVYRFGSRDWQVVPYAGLGGGFVNWRLEEVGYFIDFSSPGQEIYYAGYRATGWTWEALGLVGVEVPVGLRWSFFGEGRYRAADDELGDDFSGFGTLDLSGWEVSAGFAWNF